MPRSKADPSRVRFDELAVFVEVSAAGSLAEAARRLGLPKSTVGRAVARVEADLGASLVTRGARGPSLTEAGRVLAGLAAPHVAALRDVAASVGRRAEEAYGTLRVTAAPDLGAVMLAPLVTSFVARYPRVQVEIELSIRVVDVVREGFDLAIRIPPAGGFKPSSLVARKLARFHLGVYAGTSYLARREAPRRAEDLEDHEHVLVRGVEQDGHVRLESPSGIVRVRSPGRVVVNEFDFVRAALVAGVGVGALPWFVAKPDVDAGRLVRLLPDHSVAGTTAYVVHAPAKPLPPKLALFRAMLLEQGPRLLREPG